MDQRLHSMSNKLTRDPSLCIGRDSLAVVPKAGDSTEGYPFLCLGGLAILMNGEKLIAHAEDFHARVFLQECSRIPRVPFID